MITPDQITTMEGDVRQLRQLLVQASAAITVWDQSVAAAQRAYVKQMQELIAKLDAYRTLVFSGLQSYADWKSLAETYRTQLQGQISDAARSTLASGVAFTINETGGTVAQNLSEVKDAATSGTTWGVLAGLAVVFFAWKVLR